MPDTQTTNLAMTIMENGTHNNTWNDEYAANDEAIDAKFGDQTTVNTTGGTTSLTASQERVAVILVTGTLASNATIEFTGVGGVWVVKNGTTAGGYTVTCKVSGQTGVEINDGTTKVVYFDGTDIAIAGDGVNADEANTFTANQTIQSTDAGVGYGPLLTLDRYSASPADSDLIGSIVFKGRNASAAAYNYGRVAVEITDVSAGTEDARMYFQASKAGTLTTVLSIEDGITTFNDPLNTLKALVAGGEDFGSGSLGSNYEVVVRKVSTGNVGYRVVSGI